MKKKYRFNISDVFSFLFLAVFPLFMTNKYKNLTVSKFVFFMVCAVFSILLCYLFVESREKPYEKKGVKIKANFIERIKEFDKLKLSFIIFILLGLFSVIVSHYPVSSFCGYAGRYMGYDFLIGTACVFLFSLKYYELKEETFLFFEGSAIIVTLIAIIQFIGFDPFGLKKGIEESKLSYFLSTIGNINVFASFVSLFLPIALFLLFYSDVKKYKGLYFVGAVLGFFGVFISNSDSAYLAIFFALWFITFISLERTEKLYKSFFSVSMFFACAFIFGFIYKLLKNAYRLSNLTVLMVSSWTLIAAAAFFAAGLMIKHHPLCTRAGKKLKYIYISISVLSIVTVFSAIFYFSVINKTAKLGGFENVLRFNDDWGTQRGLVWRLSLTAFREMPLINKIFGYGEDTVVILLAGYVKKEMLASGYYTDNAHNEFIQYLLTMGVAGLSAYVSLLVFAIKKLLKRRKESVLFGALAISVMAYAVQSLVNITQPITTPLFFLFITFANCSVYGQQSLKRVNIKNMKKR